MEGGKLKSFKKAMTVAKECLREAFAYTSFMPILLIEQLMICMTNGSTIQINELDFELTQIIASAIVESSNSPTSKAPKVCASIVKSMVSPDMKRQYTMGRHVKMRESYAAKYKRTKYIRKHPFLTKAHFIDRAERLYHSNGEALVKAQVSAAELKSLKAQYRTLEKRSMAIIRNKENDVGKVQEKLIKLKVDYTKLEKQKSLQLEIDHTYVRKHKSEVKSMERERDVLVAEKDKAAIKVKELMTSVNKLEAKLAESEIEATKLKECLDKKDKRGLEDIEYILKKANVDNLSRLLNKIKKSSEVKGLEVEARKLKASKWTPLGKSIIEKVNKYKESKEPKAVSFLGLVEQLDREEKLALLNRVNFVTKHENLDNTRKYPSLIIKSYDTVGAYLDGLVNNPRELMQYSIMDSNNMFRLINRTSWMINTIVKDIYGYSNWNTNYYYLKSYKLE